MKLYQFTDNDISDTASAGMHVGIRALVEEGVITNEQADKFITTHGVTFSTKDNWLRHIWQRISKTDPTLDPKSFVYHCVKIMNINEVDK